MMKSVKYLLVVIALLCSFNVYSQLTGIGLKIGGNIGSPIGPMEEGATGSLGFSGLRGVYGRFRVFDRLHIQPELQYSYKKASFSSPISGDTVIYKEFGGMLIPFATFYEGTVKGQFDNIYLEMPVTVMWKAGDHFYLLGGPYLAYLAKGNNDGTADLVIGNNFLEKNDEPFDQSEYLSTWDYGVVGGVHFEATQGLNFGLRMTTGLRSIYVNGMPNSPGVVRNVYLQGAIGYTLNKG